MRTLRSALVALSAMPLMSRAVVIGAVSAAAVGCLIGLVVGLLTYAPTAPFAVFEAGIPAALVGALGGFVVGTITLALQRITR